MSDKQTGDKHNAGPSNITNQEDPSNNPLFGASPPPPPSDDERDPNIPAQPEAGPSNSIVGSTNPLFGATPPQDEGLPSWRMNSREYNQPRELRLYHAFKPTGPSKTIIFIKRITFIISILLGISSIFAGIWSIFILPLLHSSFSARKELINQQSKRMNDILIKLKNLKKLEIYNMKKIKLIDKEKKANEEEEEEYKEESNFEIEEANLKEISESIDNLIMNTNENKMSLKQKAKTEEEENEILPLKQIKSLSIKLNKLSNLMESTSTTRISLISTLESYTSFLHNQLFLSSRFSGTGNGGKGFSNYSIKLNSLSSHLGEKQRLGLEQKNEFEFNLGGIKIEEWDNTRKEIRAIKGLLLNRRQFVKS
ncbi:uncharacterized protein I206_105788 [Kwoniella pini CBS 10737]|uniref:Uncharacterized protein n=1 Tax=Kwoniella pini CBS 10737 TaxID=1296096 RepID=A0A1B9I0D9_9TREE|nr:uncharacterized protein I206_04608 [Kwoniella pini CBS 10737]OCF48921.1 hypothetical protein I206_04608 [Kwoniella pini CBS 10737]